MTQTIHVAHRDGKAISHNRSSQGAATAIADDAAARMERMGSSVPTDDERRAIEKTVLHDNGIDLQLRRGIGSALAGVAVERMHSIAIAVSADYRVERAVLRA